MAIHEVARDIYLVPIPIPVPLRFVNAYAFRGRSGWTLVDCGFREPGAQAAWQDAFAQLGIGPGDVERIVVTHLHPDHLGAASWLQDVTRAPVFMHDREAALVDLVWNPDWEQGKAIAGLFRQHGVPEELTRDVGQHQRGQQDRVWPFPAITGVPRDGCINLGDRAFQLVECPGHTDHLVVFWHAQEGILLVNDMVLAKITPNVPLWPRLNPDPLGSFLASLGKVGRIPARLVLPGHRSLIDDLAGRCAQITAHHGQRLDQVLALARGGATAWEICLGVFGPQPDTHQTRFAMAETLSHVEYLAHREHLRREPGEVIRYHPAR